MIKHIGIDIGTCNTKIYSEEKGILINEPSVVAINANTGRVLAVGSDAKQMIGKTPEEMDILMPIKNGAIANFDASKIMIKEFIKKAVKSTYLLPSATVCMPCFSTEVEKQALQMVLVSCGIKNVRLIYTPMAAALGASLSVNDAVGSMVVSMGASINEAAVVSMGGIVASAEDECGGLNIDDAILEFAKLNYRTILGKTTAEHIKIKIGTVLKEPEEKEITVMGRDALTGLPKEITLSSYEIKSAICAPVDKMIKTINRVIEKTPPELLCDIAKSGIMLAGNGAYLSGIDELIKEKTGIFARLLEDAGTSAAKGAASVKPSYLQRFGGAKKRARASLV